LEAIQILKKPGGSLKDSFLDEGYSLSNNGETLFLMLVATFDDFLFITF
jgi:hypothetical protein